MTGLSSCSLLTPLSESTITALLVQANSVSRHATTASDRPIIARTDSIPKAARSTCPPRTGPASSRPASAIISFRPVTRRPSYPRPRPARRTRAPCYMFVLLSCLDLHHFFLTRRYAVLPMQGSASSSASATRTATSGSAVATRSGAPASSSAASSAVVAYYPGGSLFATFSSIAVCVLAGGALLL